MGVSGRSQKIASLGSFLIEMAVYAVFVFVYFFLVLHFLGGWLKAMFDQHRNVYAVVALALMIAQGVLLEMLTTALFNVIRRKVNWGRV